MDALCRFSTERGTVCGLPAPHRWGGLDLCCGHFDELVTAMFDIKGEVQDRQHQEFVRIFEERTHHSATIEGATCDPQKPFLVQRPEKKDDGGET